MKIFNITQKKVLLLFISFRAFDYKEEKINKKYTVNCVLNEMKNMTKENTQIPTEKKLKAQRALFLDSDKGENDQFVIDEDLDTLRAKSERWNFDFINEVPIAYGKYVWKCIKK